MPSAAAAAAAALSNNSSSSTLTVASSSSAPSPLNDAPSADAPSACYYCSHLKLLRDIIPPKRCDYCHVLKCQFCTLKFPLISVKKKVLPKVMKSNSRICVQCFSHQWQENGLSSAAAAGTSDKKVIAAASSSSTARRSGSSSRRFSSLDADLRDSFIIDSTRPSSFTFDSAHSRDSLSLDSNRRESMAIDAMWAGDDSPDDGARFSFINSATDDEREALRRSFHRRSRSSSGRGAPDLTPGAVTALLEEAPIVQSLISAVDLWISIFAATILAVIVVLEGYSLQQRVCFCVATYGVFLMLHPWFHKPQAAVVALEPAAAPRANPSAVAAQGNSAVPQIRRMSSVAEEALANAPRALPIEFRKKRAKMAKTLQYYLSDDCPWKVVKTTSGGIVSEMAANDTPFPIFKIEVFITGAPMTQFVDFLDSKDVTDRARWDLNVAKFKIVETFADEPNMSVCLNTQKSFLRGLVAARDFCLLYVREDNCISFSSVEHPRAPVAADATRGNVFLSCFHCHAATGEDGTPGFILTYICQVDIGGSLPPKLLYNGTLDNMVKMIKVFKAPKKLLRL